MTSCLTEVTNIHVYNQAPPGGGPFMFCIGSSSSSLSSVQAENCSAHFVQNKLLV